MNQLDKALKHYGYEKPIDKQHAIDDFFRRYKIFTNKGSLKKFTQNVWGVLASNPNLDHIQAKHYLFIDNPLCWLYFERTAVFWVKSCIVEWDLNILKGTLEYCLYIQRFDLVKELIDKIHKNKFTEHTSELAELYPSTKLIFFLADKYTNYEPIKSIIEFMGYDYGIYQPIIDNWDDVSVLDDEYWNSLCEYHLNGLDLKNTNKFLDEEFLSSGVIPIELIVLCEVRDELQLNKPIINHPMFHTTMAKTPLVPSGYNENKDPIYCFVEETINKKKRLDYQDYIANQNDYLNLEIL